MSLALVDIAKQSSRAIISFCGTISSVWEPLLLSTLSAFGIAHVFSVGHCGGCVVVSHCGFNFNTCAPLLLPQPLIETVP